MKLKSFRIKGYKSIIDSGECRLSEHDNILVLAGQNESGKSSILQAIRDFENESIDKDNLRDDDLLPVISCTFSGVSERLLRGNAFNDWQLPDSVLSILLSLPEITVTKRYDQSGKFVTLVDEQLSISLREEFESDNRKKALRASNGKSDSGLEQAAVTDEKEEEELWDLTEAVDNLVEELVAYTPHIIFFDDFCDLLPNQILVSDLGSKGKDIRGLQAVRNVETILNADFAKLEELTDSNREKIQGVYHETITAEFNEKWKQRIAEGSGAKIHVKHYRDKDGTAYLKFYIETKKGEFLPVGKRSQGFKWFLSFYLHLKAEDRRKNNLIILFDEPGMYLHSKAQLDMIKVFEELAQKNQIIYTTHSPYLIDTSRLSRVRLVFNYKNQGTIVDKVTSNKSGYQVESLKPIIDAMGLEVASPFSVAKKHNVILEGISDLQYVLAMKEILGRANEVAFLPSMGSSNSHLLMEICIGWGLDWILVFDDKGANKDYAKIKKFFFDDNNEDASKKIYILKDCDGIEDMFAIKDMKLVNADADFSQTKKNSAVVAEYGGKELYSRFFYEKVKSGLIVKEQLSQKSIKEFTKLFDFIEQQFNLQK